MQQQFLSITLEIINNILQEIIQDGLELSKDLDCNATVYNEQTLKRFEELLNAALSKEDSVLLKDNLSLKPKLTGSVEVGGNGSESLVAKYDEPLVTLVANKTVKRIKNFYRIGLTHVSILKLHAPISFF